MGQPSAGHRWDPDVQQYFASFRYYSPTTARWLTRDPLGMVDGPNVYLYATMNPLRFADPLGLASAWADVSYWTGDDWYDWAFQMVWEFINGYEPLAGPYDPCAEFECELTCFALHHTASSALSELLLFAQDMQDTPLNTPEGRYIGEWLENLVTKWAEGERNLFDRCMDRCRSMKQ